MGAVRALVIVEVDPSRLQELSLSDTRQQVKPDSSADVDVGLAVDSLCECRQLLRPHPPLVLALGKLVDAIGGGWFRWIGVSPSWRVSVHGSEIFKQAIRFIGPGLANALVKILDLPGLDRISAPALPCGRDIPV